MEKFEKDGKIAVLYSPGFGAGWSSWNKEEEDALCMDARIVTAFIAGGTESAAHIAKTLFPNVYVGGAKDLQIEWLDKGTVFKVEEYDGNESLHIIGEEKYLVA